ncbi:3TM-type holin [Candidatus Margulisiibacteriota bacterium]
MDIFGFLGGLVKPVTDMVDNLHTSDKEKMELNNALAALQNQTALKLLDYEKEKMKAQSDIIKAEAQGQSWLQRSWRPITMLTFLLLVVCDSFGWLKFRLAEQAWTLLQIGLGGYVVGRSAEKIVPGITQALKKN